MTNSANPDKGLFFFSCYVPRPTLTAEPVIIFALYCFSFLDMGIINVY